MGALWCFTAQSTCFLLQNIFISTDLVLTYVKRTKKSESMEEGGQATQAWREHANSLSHTLYGSSSHLNGYTAVWQPRFLAQQSSLNIAGSTWAEWGQSQDQDRFLLNGHYRKCFQICGLKPLAVPQRRINCQNAFKELARQKKPSCNR